MRKVRILSLHGYGQDVDMFRKKTGGLRSPVKQLAVFEFTQAPHVVDDGDGGFAWYLRKFGSESSITDVRHSLKCLNEHFRTHGPFDGVFGFSQGASFAVLLSALLAEDQRTPLGTALKELVPDISFQFCAVFAGFFPRETELKEIVTSSPLLVRSFHCYGDGDGIISPQMSAEATRQFAEPVVVTHEGGHFVPTNATIRRAFKDFITAQVEAVDATQPEASSES